MLIGCFEAMLRKSDFLMEMPFEGLVFLAFTFDWLNVKPSLHCTGCKFAVDSS